MSIKDNRYEVYVCGYYDTDYINKTYIENYLNKYDFNLTESIEHSDFILIMDEYKLTNDAIFSKEYADINLIEITNDLDRLLKLRDEYEFIGVI